MCLKAFEARVPGYGGHWQFLVEVGQLSTLRHRHVPDCE